MKIINDFIKTIYYIESIMKILQFGNSDLIVRGFNGSELKNQTLKRNIRAEHCVWEKSLMIKTHGN